MQCTGFLGPSIVDRLLADLESAEVTFDAGDVVGVGEAVAVDVRRVLDNVVQILDVGYAVAVGVVGRRPTGAAAVIVMT